VVFIPNYAVSRGAVSSWVSVDLFLSRWGETVEFFDDPPGNPLGVQDNIAINMPEKEYVER